MHTELFQFLYEAADSEVQIVHVGEILGLTLCTLQNISFFMWLTATARERILQGTFREWKNDFLERFNDNDKA